MDGMLSPTCLWMITMKRIKWKCPECGGAANNELAVTVKIGDNEYRKHYLGLSDNVTYIVEQLDYSDVSPYKYELVFKPQSIVPITINRE